MCVFWEAYRRVLFLSTFAKLQYVCAEEIKYDFVYCKMDGEVKTRLCNSSHL